MDALDDFMRGRARALRAGHPCLTCIHPNRAEVDKALVRFNVKRKAGKAGISWELFTREFLRPELGYQHNYRAAKGHLERCLGQTVH